MYKQTSQIDAVAKSSVVVLPNVASVDSKSKKNIFFETFLKLQHFSVHISQMKTYYINTNKTKAFSEFTCTV